MDTNHYYGSLEEEGAEWDDDTIKLKGFNSTDTLITFSKM